MPFTAKKIQKLKQLKKFLFWIPIFTFILGVGISVYVYKSLQQRELAALQAESFSRSKELINQIDLLFSNSILRIQSYEEYIGSKPRTYKQDAGFISQSLPYTIFQRISIFRKIQNKDPKTGYPKLKVILRVNTKNSTLPPSVSDYMVSELSLKGVQRLDAKKTFQEAVLHNFLDVPQISFILRSKTHSDVYFVYTAPLSSVFAKTELRPGESLDIMDETGGLSWTVKGSGSEKAVVASGGVPGPNTLHHQFNFSEGMPQSGLKLNFRFNYLQQVTLSSSALIAGLMSLLISFVVSFLFYVLVRQNSLVTRLVIEKTNDLEKARHELEEILLGKSRFLGNISHEIRTPLNLILGMVDLCEEEDTNKKISQYLASMRASGNHLLSMIEDLLDLSKSESNDLQISPMRVNLIQFLDEVARLAGQDCSKKGLRFYASFAGDLPAAIKTDPSRLRQILMNLLRNACKYTSQGHVQLRVCVLAQQAQKTQIRFEVSDSGIGIPEDKLAKIFDAFFQIEGSYALSEGGVGLGLAIVKELVRKLGGSMHVKSQPKKGSTFQVDLDVEVLEEQSWLTAFKVTDNQIRKLQLVSQDPRWVESISVLSMHESIEVHSAQIGSLPGLLARSGQDPYSWLVIDTTAPGFAIESLKKLGAHQNILLAGNKRQIADANHNLKVTVLDHTPVLATDILNAMGLMTRQKKKAERKQIQPPVATAHISESESNRTFIVADDDMGNKELYMAYFEGSPWKIQYAMNGQEAWELYLREQPDLLVLDVRMPVMDGFEVVEKVRAQELQAGTPPKPILLVTADALSSTEEKALQYPKVSFLTKPIRKSVLFDSIRKMLE